jgi:hypothetical protein
MQTDFDAFNLYNSYKELTSAGVYDSDTAPYLRFQNAEANDTNGINVYFGIEESTGYTKRLHDTAVSFDWSQEVKDKYRHQVEAIGKKGAGKIAQMKVNIKQAAKQEAQKISGRESTSRTKTAFKKLEALNKAVSNLENQYGKGLITKAEYRKQLKKLYNL